MQKMRSLTFKSFLVNQIIHKVKTETRRLQGLKEINQNPAAFTLIELIDGKALFQNKHTGELKSLECPYGCIGDLLYVKETFTVFHGEFNGIIKDKVLYRADGEYDYLKRNPNWKGWKSGRFMSKRNARLFMDITEIDVQRLRDIDKQSAINEGIEINRLNDRYFVYKDYNPVMLGNDLPVGYENPVNSFISLWVSINGPESFSHNPWVWVIKFKLIDVPEEVQAYNLDLENVIYKTKQKNV